MDSLSRVVRASLNHEIHLKKIRDTYIYLFQTFFIGTESLKER
jgi:hypothetical protein